MPMDESRRQELAEVYKQTYHDYLERIAGIDFRKVGPKLGFEVVGESLIASYFREKYEISHSGMKGVDGKKPPLSTCVVLFNYLLRCPQTEPEDDHLVTYRNFKDGAPFAGAFENNCERALALGFSGKIDQLIHAARHLGGEPPPVHLPHQFSMTFQSLPKLPITLAFNDKDEEFPADATMLFEARAQVYLDMESLAMVGWALAENLLEFLAGRDEHLP